MEQKGPERGRGEIRGLGRTGCWVTISEVGASMGCCWEGALTSGMLKSLGSWMRSWRWSRAKKRAARQSS